MTTPRQKGDLWQKLANEQEILALRAERDRLKKNFCEYAGECFSRISKLQEKNGTSIKNNS